VADGSNQIEVRSIPADTPCSARQVRCDDLA
jgi:hypothetical protein